MLRLLHVPRVGYDLRYLREGHGWHFWQRELRKPLRKRNLRDWIHKSFALFEGLLSVVKDVVDGDVVLSVQLFKWLNYRKRLWSEVRNWKRR